MVVALAGRCAQPVPMCPYFAPLSTPAYLCVPVTYFDCSNYGGVFLLPESCCWNIDLASQMIPSVKLRRS